ncbi:hypothetical protein HerbRD11066_14110 [Herbidospora sp. RD11066]
MGLWEPEGVGSHNWLPWRVGDGGGRLTSNIDFHSARWSGWCRARNAWYPPLADVSSPSVTWPFRRPVHVTG